MSEPMFLVPVFDMNTLACQTIAVAASCEAAAVGAVLRNAAQLRYTGGKVERVEVNPETTVANDPWAERYKPARLKENVR
jgi:hypothetical protein